MTTRNDVPGMKEAEVLEALATGTIKMRLVMASPEPERRRSAVKSDLHVQGRKQTVINTVELLVNYLTYRVGT